jgi:hypothetical protein
MVRTAANEYIPDDLEDEAVREMLAQTTDLQQPTFEHGQHRNH